MCVLVSRWWVCVCTSASYRQRNMRVLIIYKACRSDDIMVARDVLSLCVTLAIVAVASAHVTPTAAKRAAAHSNSARMFYSGRPVVPGRDSGHHGPSLHKPGRGHNASALVLNHSYTTIDSIWNFFNTNSTTTRRTVSSGWARLPVSQSEPALQRVLARCAFCGNITRTQHPHVRRSKGMPALRTNRTAVHRAASARVTRQHTLWQ